MWPKMRYEKQVDQVIIFRIFLNLYLGDSYKMYFKKIHRNVCGLEIQYTTYFYIHFSFYKDL